MYRQTLEPTSRLIEFWLADGKPAGPGVSFSLDFDVTPPARPTRLPKAPAAEIMIMTGLPPRRRLSPTQRRMS